jgi:hypothetical protein
MIVQRTPQYFQRLNVIAALGMIPNRRNFAYSHSEIKVLEIKVKKKLQVLRMFSEMKDFNYETPDMIYDKKSGEIKI